MEVVWDIGDKVMETYEKDKAIRDQLDYIELQFNILRNLINKRCHLAGMNGLKTRTPRLSQLLHGRRTRMRLKGLIK